MQIYLLFITVNVFEQLHIKTVVFSCACVLYVSVAPFIN